MKQSIGYTATLNIVIVFIIIIFAVFAMSLSYYRAYKVSNKITESIEKYEGYNYLAESEIKTKLKSLGYNFSSVSCVTSLGGCPLFSPTYGDDVDNSVIVNKYSGELGYCVYTCPTDKDNYVKYKVTTNMMWNIPIINNIVNIPVEIKTRELYGFWDIPEEETPTVYEFSYTRTVQEFVVPKTGEYLIELWGAQGGSCSADDLTKFKTQKANEYPQTVDISMCEGGKGAYTSGHISLSEGEILYIVVGGPGNTGGYNGGGSAWSDRGAGGGGATDVRLKVYSGRIDAIYSLGSRIMVAAGGGGAQVYYYPLRGGDGGTINGNAGNIYRGINTPVIGIAAPAPSQTTSGDAQLGTSYPNWANDLNRISAKFGIGGTGSTTGGGGGGGYYGGHAGIHGVRTVGSGAGGSSFISGANGYIAIEKEPYSFDNITHKTNSIHYSGKIFTNTSSTAGINSGAGKAKITLIG